MSRHVIDKRQSLSDSRLRRFMKIARESTPHQASRKLIARLRGRTNDRLTAYARIARGRST